LHVSHQIDGLKIEEYMPTLKGMMGLCAAALLVAVSGCSSYGSARIQSVPPGAEVINLGDEASLGDTPVMITRKADREESRRISIRLRKQGYNDEVHTFWLNIRNSSRYNAEYYPQEISVELTPVK
jgi:hypothetical protein